MEKSSFCFVKKNVPVFPQHPPVYHAINNESVEGRDRERQELWNNHARGRDFRGSLNEAAFELRDVFEVAQARKVRPTISDQSLQKS